MNQKKRESRWLWRAVVAVLAPVLVLGGLGGLGPQSPPAQAAPLPAGLGPCVGDDCPATHPAIGNGPIAGRDEAVNIFVGGDFRVRGGAAEAEGRVVTLGAFDMNRTRGGDIYNVGEVGVGSRVPPPAGSDWLVSGGGVTVADGKRLLAEGGVVRHSADALGDIRSRVVRDAEATRPYRSLRAELTDAATCYAYPNGNIPRPATGTAVNRGGETVFTGDGTSALQVFTVDFDLTGPRGAQQGLVFRGIPAGATVLVNVLGDARTISTYSGGITDDDPLNGLRGRLLWNFPRATQVVLTGTGQFQGSVLAGNPAGETEVTVPGVNGRLFTAGSLTHGSPTVGSGQELHAYPFDGDLPDCGRPVPVIGTVAVVKRDAQTGEALPGARFQLWRESNGTSGLQTTGATPDTAVGEVCTTGDDGRCARSIEPGSYYWQETAAPDGYRLPDPSVFGPLAVTAENAQRGVSVTVRNEPAPAPDKRADLVVMKRDAATGKPLRGAVFELWRESNNRTGLQTAGRTPDTLVDPGCATSATGRCVFADQPEGVYYLRETDVPEGYRVPAQPVTGPYVLNADSPERVVIRLANTRGEPDKGKGSDPGRK
ncbi:choice-of-anchor A family protein [Streptomyces sp. 549]|uniref:choice-of-anchor A family protein n=1 Tax=Streptomyces sp. 549 TaxID=3049076 RepID=UPI0024C32F44|nr:choice-of-anchor A family protein [Streptomyces sp. 549]MDK1475378.1 choice-of-anchor A family protein [Streptomyces sp. 549]